MFGAYAHGVHTVYQGSPQDGPHERELGEDVDAGDDQSPFVPPEMADIDRDHGAH